MTGQAERNIRASLEMVSRRADKAVANLDNEVELRRLLAAMMDDLRYVVGQLNADVPKESGQ